MAPSHEREILRQIHGQISLIKRTFCFTMGTLREANIKLKIKEIYI